MALRNVAEQGDPVLTKKARPVRDFNGRLWILLDDMRDTLSNAGGAGLAAADGGQQHKNCKE